MRKAPGVGKVPEGIWVGVGIRPEASADEIEAALGILDGTDEVLGIATLDRRVDHPALVEVARRRSVPIRGFAATDLAAVAVPTPSERVRDAVGSPAVAEAAAILAAGGGPLVVPKRSYRSVTVAAARKVS
ncbi:cobalt-precorrin 5A hydrolase [Rhodococcus triatomae]|uniref:Cobalt-precorrin 5A hydrolase n=1 Tax=Rhodococcus triatomae TaxID=300028 RepID=A0A1G8Q6D2_9NOCA|nr:cobalamin biosynthesis protein [Rhodococcus triatomae]SDJ00287.1 cobalt-precorrin 5A hydrolase [Rhodococcus triatomae]